MTREEFRSQVFSRDEHTCVIPGCGRPAADPHHIIERALWSKGDPFPEGYHIHNGASLCEIHHIHAEQNAYPPQALRRWLGIPTILPKSLDKTKIWDKWGKEIPRAVNGKYPSTPYLPFSPTVEADDNVIDLKSLFGKPLVLTIKMDGSNVVLTKEKVAARNGDHAAHASFNLLKSQHAGFRHLIPDGITIFGEWLYARHSIAYEGEMSLKSYLMIFSLYDQKHELFLGWDEVKEFAESNGFVVVPTVGEINQYNSEWKISADIFAAYSNIEGHEGIVVRNVFPFHYGQFEQNVAKLVRPDHNQCPPDWKRREIIKNQVGAL